MSKFLKNFALGLLYFLLLPLELAVLVIYGLYCLGLYSAVFFKGTIRFFRGKKFFAPFPEDLKKDEIRAAQIDMLAHPNGTPTPAPSAPAGPSTVYVQQNYYTGNGPAAGAPNANKLPPNNGPIDANGFFKPNPQINNPEANSIDMSTQQTPGIPIHHIDEQGRERPEIPQTKKIDTKTVSIIDISKMDDGKDDE
ncbi:MAG: hypothetical protein LKG11_05095 [Bacilli bacterium]|jgi:hypothetical protein|nr:hypothetical protein [Bacilli bacterium]